jgi:hypothetical protein
MSLTILRKLLKNTSPKPKRGKRVSSKSDNLKGFRWSRSTSIIVLGIFLLGGGSILAQPVSHEGTEEKAIVFGTKYQDEKSIELGTEKVAQNGKPGVRYTKYRYTQSLFDRLFRKDRLKKEVLDTGIISNSTDRVVLKGTKKWQYMMCSNGSYRYYTDEQFKGRNTGFTSKSSDDCAANNQGKKVKLADSPDGSNNTTKPTYVPPNCRMVDIPYKTIYEDVSWLYVGETQEGTGVDGFKYICTDGSVSASINPMNKTIYRGTRQRENHTTHSVPTIPTGPTQDYAAKYICDRDYNYARAQLSIMNASGSSAMIQLQSAYAQCLRNAGF